MSDTKPVSATLELVYVPDTYTDTERQDGASWPLGSGFYDLVVIAGDARIPLHRFKAGAIDKIIAQAKEKREQATADTAASTPDE